MQGILKEIGRVLVALQVVGEAKINWKDEEEIIFYIEPILIGLKIAYEIEGVRITLLD
jgi:hypothetical protein